MSIPAGTYKLGPENGTISVRTGRRGAAAKAGHDLLIHVTSWAATIEVGEDPAQTSVTLDADGGSLLVREGTGGMQTLGEDDKAGIKQTIDDDVLRRQEIRFRSSEVRGAAEGDRITVRGELTLVGKTNPVAFELVTGDGGALSAVARLKQSDWGIKPYSALFGALKVADEVEIAIQATLPSG
jgi:polyisoprenoid-binding protein YceI